MLKINHDDPISTAAAALALAGGLRPDIEATLRRPSRQAGAPDLAELDTRMKLDDLCVRQAAKHALKKKRGEKVGIDTAQDQSRAGNSIPVSP